MNRSVPGSKSSLPWVRNAISPRCTRPRGTVLRAYDFANRDEAAAAAREAGIPVFTIAYGTAQGTIVYDGQVEPVPVTETAPVPVAEPEVLLASKVPAVTKVPPV
jgi:hypothetical protein